MRIKQFNKVKTTEDEQLKALACEAFGVDPTIEKSIEEEYNLFVNYKALQDYEDNQTLLRLVEATKETKALVKFLEEMEESKKGE